MEYKNLTVMRFSIDDGAVSDLEKVQSDDMDEKERNYLLSNLHAAYFFMQNKEFIKFRTILFRVVEKGYLPLISQWHEHFENAFLEAYGLNMAKEIVERFAEAGIISVAAEEPGVSFDDFNEWKESNRDNKLSSVMISAMPRSASTFVSELLRTPYRGPPRVFKVGLAEFPSRRVICNKVRLLNGGGVFCKDHFLPTEENLQALREAGFLKVFVMLRDPRQALLSWAHEAHNQFCMDDRPFQEIDYMEIRDFCAADLSERIDLLMGDYYSGLVSFADRWTQIYEDQKDNGIAVEIAEFKELKRDLKAYLGKIVGFFGLPDSILAPLEDASEIRLVQGKQLVFRKGETDEWKDTFSPLQHERTTELIPDYLMEKYDWTRV